MEKELLQRAIDSILHGSTQIVNVDDGIGGTYSNTIRVGDLRPQLVESLAKRLVETDGFQKALEQAFTQEVVSKVVKEATEQMKFSELPYQLKNKIEEKMSEENLSFKKFTMKVEVIEKENEA